MKITKEILLEDVPGIYAAGVVVLGGQHYYAFASEVRDGKIYLVHTVTGDIIIPEGCAGGVMAVVDLKGEDAFLAIERFYPVFDSKDAILVKYDIPYGEKVLRRSLVAAFPYLHRTAIVNAEDHSFIAAGRLCRQKDYVEDWSTPGDMEIAMYSGEEALDTEAFKIVQEGIFRHHALWVHPEREGDRIFYGGTEGVFSTSRNNGRWETVKMLDIPASDVVYEDLDDDGCPELAVIEEFHGNLCAVYKMVESEWKRCAAFPLEFGHVLWGGRICGRSALITGSRAGEKQLILRRFAPCEDGMTVTEELVIDKGGAPAQITVMEENGAAVILAANHGAAEAVLYRIE